MRRAHPLSWPKGRAAALTECIAATVILGAGTVLLAGARRDAPVTHDAAPIPPSAAAGARLWVDMKNVALRIDDHATMNVRELRGEVLANTADHVAVLDDLGSFRIRVTAGTVALDGAAVTALLNEVVFDYPGSPLRHLRVSVGNGEIVQRGVMHKGVAIPFEIHAKPVLEPDGRVRLHPTTMKIFGGVNGLALLHALGLHLEKMLNLKGSAGAVVRDDDIILDPARLLPPPRVDGRLAWIRVQGNLLVQSFVRTTDDTMFGTVVRPDSGVRNYVFFRGGYLRFGKLTMTNTDLLISDADERDPLDLYIKRYN